MKPARIFAILLITTGLVGCGDVTPWKTVTTKDRTYVVNRFTGQTYEVVGQQLLELPKRSAEEFRAEEARKATTYLKSEPNRIPETDFKISLEARHLDNRMLYRVTVSPVRKARLVPAVEADGAKKSSSEKPKDPSADKEAETTELRRDSLEKQLTEIVVKLVDDHAFVIKQIPTSTAYYNPTVDDSGKIRKFSYSGSSEISEQTYRAAKRLSYSWRASEEKK